MPHIKNKPFLKHSVTCYKCGHAIEYGTMNWSYNTRSAGKFSHRDCNLLTVITETVINEDGLTELNDDIPVYVENTQGADITDLIVEKGKHKVVKKIKRRLRRRKFCFLHGAPGAGKSYLADQLAQDMNIRFLPISTSEDMFKSELIGSKSPVSGNFIETLFYDFWKNSGLVLIDESGIANGSFLNVMNNALANKKLTFPSGETVTMHEHFFIMFADNSNLWGDDPLFPERQDAGGAFRDRLVYCKTEYDEDIELMVCIERFEGDERRAKRWHDVIKRMRRAMPSDLPIFISPRFAYAACSDWLDGFTFDEILEDNLFQGRENTDRDTITTALEILKRWEGTY